MQTLRLYLRIFRKSGIVTCITFLVVYSVICALTINNDSQAGNMSFDSAKASVAILDEDNTPTSRALVAYFASQTDPIYVDSNDGLTAIQDGLFAGYFTYGIVIPKGFEVDFMNGGTGGATSYQQSSTSAALAEQILENYMNVAALYRDTIGFDAEKVTENLSLSVDASVRDGSVAESNDNAYYVNYLVYPIAAVCLSSVTLVMLIFNDSETRRRILCAPLKPMKHSFQLFLGNLIIGLLTFGVLVGVLSFYNPALYDTFRWRLWMGNIAIFTLLALCMSFLFSSFCKKSMVSALSNIVSLGMCFLGGVFVPQEVMDPNLLRVMVLNPAYWYVRLNNEIAAMPDSSWSSISDIGWMALIELAFAVAFLSLALALSKRRKA